VHERTYPFSCDVCEKGFQYEARLQEHLKRHPEQLHALRPCLRLHDEWVSDLHQQLMLMQQEKAKQVFPRCSAQGCAVSHKHAASSFFSCFKCKKPTHWMCAGHLAEAMVREPAIVLCPRCLDAQHPLACILAVGHANLLIKYITHHLKQQVVYVPADGMCLLRSTAIASGNGNEGEHIALLRNALQCVLDMASDNGIRQMCQELIAASNSALVTKVRTYWDSPLFDVLPEALAKYLQRPLRIFFIMTGEIRTVTAGATLKGQAISLMRTFSELGYDHYDAIVAY
jgi:hypothetical protein